MRKALLLAGGVLLLDLLTKAAVRAWLATYEAIEVTPFLNIVHVRNRGAAFGLFSSFGNAFFILVAGAASLAVLYYMVRVPEQRPVMALILGGAAGNLVDRFRQGYVTDFVDLHVGDLHWPAFNVADSALTLAIVFLVVTAFRGGREEPGGAAEVRRPPGSDPPAA